LGKPGVTGGVVTAVWDGEGELPTNGEQERIIILESAIISHEADRFRNI
jgi:hypothetical protein